MDGIRTRLHTTPGRVSLRDAAYTAFALRPIGLPSEAGGFLDFSVRHGVRITTLIDSTGGFVVNVLGAGQHALARRFADPNRPTGTDCFAAVETAGAPASGGMRLAGTVGHFACRTVNLVKAGDHTIVVGLVEECGILSTADPLLFMNGEFRSVLSGSLQ